MLDARALAFRFISLAFVILLAAACRGGGDDLESTDSTPAANAASDSTAEAATPSEAATLTSTDGRAELLLPVGALPDGVSISDVAIVAVPTDDLFASDDVLVLAAYELQPERLQLSQPARLRLRLSKDTPPGLLLILHDFEGGEEFLPVLLPQDGAPADEIVVEVLHFSTVQAVLAQAAFEALRITVSVESGTEHDVDVPFFVEGEILVPQGGFTVPRFTGSRGNSYDVRFTGVLGSDPAFWHATPLVPADPSREVRMQTFTDFSTSLKCKSEAEDVPLWAEVAVDLLFEYDVFTPDLEFSHTVRELAAEMRRVEEVDIIVVTRFSDPQLPRQEDRPRLHSDDVFIDCNAPIVETPTATPTATPTETPPHDGTVPPATWTEVVEGNGVTMIVSVQDAATVGQSYVVQVSITRPDGGKLLSGEVFCTVARRGDPDARHDSFLLSSDGTATLAIQIPDSWQSGDEVALFCFFGDLSEDAQLISIFFLQ